MYASANGYTDAMEVLIKAGANKEGRDKFGFTALMIAATQGEVEAIQFLLASGAQLEATDNFGFTALMKARQQKHPDAAKVLEDAARPSGAASSNKRPAPDASDEQPASKKQGKQPKVEAPAAAEEGEEEEDDDDDDGEEEEEVEHGPLPPGWREVFDDEGDPYYVAPDGVTTQWERPDPPASGSGA